MNIIDNIFVDLLFFTEFNYNYLGTQKIFCAPSCCKTTIFAFSPVNSKGRFLEKHQLLFTAKTGFRGTQRCLEHDSGFNVLLTDIHECHKMGRHGVTYRK